MSRICVRPIVACAVIACALAAPVAQTRQPFSRIAVTVTPDTGHRSTQEQVDDVNDWLADELTGRGRPSAGR